MKKNRLWKFLTSVHLAVGTIGIILVILVIGTLLNQEKASAYLYHAWWFIGLLLLFCLNLLLCTINRFRLKISFLGVFLTHLGILLIALGAVLGSIFGEKGYLGLSEGKTVDSYQGSSDNEIKLPFKIRLDKFEVERYPPRLFIALQDGSIQDSFIPAEGKLYKLDRDYQVMIDKIFMDYQLKETVLQTSQELKNPAIEIEVVGAHDKTMARQWLWAEDKERCRLTLPQSSLDIVYKRLSAKADLEHEFNSEHPLPAEKLFVMIDKEGISKDFPVKINQEFKVNPEYTVKIEEYTPDYRMRDHSIENLPPRNPALHIVISGPEDVEKRWVFSKFPDFDKMHKVRYPDIKLLYHRPAGEHRKNIIKILEIPDNQRMIAFIKAGTLTQTSLLSAKHEFLPKDLGLKIRLLKFIPDAQLKQEELNVSNEPRNRAVKLTVLTPTGPESLLLEENNNMWRHLKDHQFFLNYWQDANDIKDFKSQLTILNDNQEVLTKTIEVNYPLSYGGYRFYQSGWDPEQTGWSRIQVVKDPGVLVVYLGFIITMLGMVYACFFKPQLRKRGTPQ